MIAGQVSFKVERDERIELEELNTYANMIRDNFEDTKVLDHRSTSRNNTGLVELQVRSESFEKIVEEANTALRNMKQSGFNGIALLKIKPENFAVEV